MCFESGMHWMSECSEEQLRRLNILTQKFAFTNLCVVIIQNIMQRYFYLILIMEKQKKPEIFCTFPLQCNISFPTSLEKPSLQWYSNFCENSLSF